jgi:uncharacterized cupin superfamily protein
MPERLDSPTIVPAAGDPPKEIAELVGMASTGDDVFSVARMRTAGGWIEPGQTAEFDEVTYVVSGEVHVRHAGGVERLTAGEGILVRAGERVRYSTPVAADTLENDTGPDDANHAQDGMIVAAGAGVGARGPLDAHLLDVAPTVLELLGMDVPADMRGRSLAPKLAA